MLLLEHDPSFAGQTLTVVNPAIVKNSKISLKESVKDREKCPAIQFVRSIPNFQF